MAKEKDSSPQILNTLNKVMIKDLNESFISDGVWTHARNATNVSHDGQLGVLGNEPANLHCVTMPYTQIGFININSDEWAVMSTDDINCEIGIFNSAKCTYTKKVNDPRLGFKRSHLITGVFRVGHKCDRIIYWDDFGLNFSRKMDIDNPPFKIKRVKQGDCYIETPTTELDIEKLRIAPLIDVQCLKLSKGKGVGTLPNGSYQVAAAYTINGIRVTDYLTISNVQPLFEHNNLAGALELNISLVDQDFDQIELVLISTVNQQTVARKMGNYSTRQNVVYIDTIDPTLPAIPLSNLPIRSQAFEKSDSMWTVGKYLIRSGVYTKPEFNYQPQANKIKTFWNAIHYPADYYEKGGSNPSYMGDENYCFFIRFFHNTGDRTASYLISGRAPEPSDLTLVSSADAPEGGLRRWQVYNTATITSLASSVLPDGGELVAKGQMGYHESTEKYPDNQPEIWGDLCGKFIRHHKFPDATVHPLLNHYSDNGKKIRVLGVSFENITPPLDEKGNVIESIIGYEILRGSREGQKTIIAKGIINNMRGYKVPDSSLEGLYPNYPYNDLRPDVYHTSNKQLIEKGTASDKKDNPLTTYYKDTFTFHSPNTTFVHPFLPTSEIKIYNELTGTAQGKFEAPYKHSKMKAPTDLTKIIAKVVGFMGAINVALGSANVSIGATEDLPLNTSLISPTNYPFQGPGSGASNLILQVGKAIADTVTLVALAAVTQEQVTRLFVALIPRKQYALQYNSHGFYDQSLPAVEGNMRRLITESSYIKGGLQTFDNKRLNNIYRTDSVVLKLSADVADPTTIDDSRRLINDSPGLNAEFNSTISAHYAAIKVPLDGQYGQIGSVKQIPVHSCVQPLVLVKNQKHSSEIMFGGDVYINRYTEKNTFFFFNDWLVGEPDEFEFNYRNGINIPYPRYWIDNQVQNYASLKNPHNYRHLNRFGHQDTVAFYIQNGYFYLFNNGVRDFFVESEINLAHRDWEEEDSKRHYDPKRYTDIQMMFRSDIIKSGNFYKYDFSLSISQLYTNFISWGEVLPIDYDPTIASTCYSYYPKRAIYSLPQDLELKKDNWSVFLTNNYKDFTSKITAIKSIGKTGAIIMLQDESPIQFTGVDTLETDAGTKITIGDGGLFNQALQNISNSDNAYQYGSCDNRLSVLATPAGIFWMSQETGKIFSFTNNMNEISREGIKYWLATYLPSFLLKDFPNFEIVDNPVIGIGCQAVYDSVDEIVYFTKKDYALRKEYKGKLTYISGLNFSYEGKIFKLGNPIFFEDASWTLSYDPKQKGYISYHDWKPELVVPDKERFFTVKDRGIWKHNVRNDLYCNFYGIDYPFEVEFPISTGQSVTTLQSVEYQLECYEYQPNGADKIHLLDFNFDRAMIYNSEQHSGFLRLNAKKKEDANDSLNYPIFGNNLIDIEYSKEENKYRFNQFCDITKNRGEFGGVQVPMFETESNGYIRLINSKYVNYNKSVLEHKKFRHYLNKVFLRRLRSGNVKMLFKLFNSKINPSIR